jgi:hypothetical protein
MKLLQKLITKPKIFQRTLGLDFAQFKLLILRMKPLWKQAECERRKRKSRQRKIGGGRPYNCKTLDDMTAIVLLYYKTYMTQELIGLIAGLDQSNVSRLLKKILPLIEQAADPELATYLAQAKDAFEKIPPHQRLNDFGTFLQKYPDLKEVATDATEQQCYRSENYETQKKYYSGKTKQHSLKTQISVSITGRVLDVSETVPGSIHDKKLADQENTVRKFPERTVQRMDSGYQGMIKEHPEFYIVLPHKKPRKEELSPLAKELNRTHSKRRVIVENVLSRIKKFRISAGLYRGDIGDYNAIFRNIVALINFKLATTVVSV